MPFKGDIIWPVFYLIFEQFNDCFISLIVSFCIIEFWNQELFFLFSQNIDVLKKNIVVIAYLFQNIDIMLPHPDNCTFPVKVFAIFKNKVEATLLNSYFKRQVEFGNVKVVIKLFHNNITHLNIFT